jgi:excinuclease ABC subunit C
VTPAAYTEAVDGLAAFLDGDRADLTAHLRGEMQAAAGRLEYEHAARLRDQLASVEKALQRQELVSARLETFDLIAIEEDDLEAAVVVFNVTRGRLTGRRTSVLDKVEDVTPSELVGIVLGQTYGGEEPPRLVLLHQLPDDLGVWEQWLARRRGSAVEVRVPQRGSKRRLLETARANAREEFGRHRLKRASDHNARAKALRSLQEHLGLAKAPLRIECYDISTIQGSDTVGSMVVFEDGLPRKSEYRRFKVKSVSGQDDFAAMEEVLRRRFGAYKADLGKPVEERGKFAYPPSLVIIDGGAGQMGRAVQVLGDYDLDIPVAGLAKRLEEVYQPGRQQPLMIPRGEDALYLLQSVRDEAHRFAVTYHRQLRSKRMVDSVLDSIPGVGPKRKRDLLRRFGSLKRLRAATFEEIAEVVPEGVANELVVALTGPAGGSR